ncbi:hypothetical protein MPSEU_001095300 [Mayamaea pseudoterrestris]|nr:hypothetical protein MPSEU_001095300 [Mayamaea pseudoterrestris]
MVLGRNDCCTFVIRLLLAASWSQCTSALSAAERRWSASSTHCHRASRKGIPQSASLSTSRLYFARTYKSAMNLEDDDSESSLIPQREPQRVAERPTDTLTERPRPKVYEPPRRKKIVVLGASGKIGRLVVRHLLDSSIDATIVAYCRDYDKACRVLFDDLIAVKTTTRADSGPTLQIVQGELVQPGRQQSAMDVTSFVSTFYNESLQQDDAVFDSCSNHPLHSLASAMRGASVVISCVGAIRPTNLWKDLLERPLWRLLRPNVDKWCRDTRHPYYVHYESTRIVLQLAEQEERERRRRIELEQTADTTVAATPAKAFADEALSQHRKQNQPAHQQERLRFVRISDLSVARAPWHLVPLFTNMLHSMVLRYQEMAEQTMHASPWVETIVLRPGDLVSWNYNGADIDYDEDDMGERDVNTTAIQVGIHGRVPEPSRIGRDDVAALAVAAALFNQSKASSPTELESLKINERKTQQQSSHIKDISSQPPFHYTLACRWVGEQLHPYPPQGSMSDGHVDAAIAMDSALTTLLQKKQRRSTLEQRMKNETISSATSSNHGKPPRRRRAMRLKPYGICVAIPTYFLLYMVTRRILQATGQLPLLQPLVQWIGKLPIINGISKIVGGAAACTIKFLSRKGTSSQQYIPI